LLSIDEFHPFKFSTGQKKKKKKKKTPFKVQVLFKACVLVQVTVPSQTCLYRLVSVVEHYGIAGSGHYTVYRSVRADSHKKEVPDEQFEPATSWFCVSDSEVHGVSEKDVLDAEASLLFYEKIV
jgi:ubiquitin C-terminal hydrolase